MTRASGRAQAALAHDLAKVAVPPEQSQVWDSTTPYFHRMPGPNPPTSAPWPQQNPASHVATAMGTFEVRLLLARRCCRQPVPLVRVLRTRHRGGASPAQSRPAFGYTSGRWRTVGLLLDIGASYCGRPLMMREYPPASDRPSLSFRAVHRSPSAGAPTWSPRQRGQDREPWGGPSRLPPISSRLAKNRSRSEQLFNGSEAWENPALEAIVPS